MGTQILSLFFGVALAVFILFYFLGRKYLPRSSEGFQAGSAAGAGAGAGSKTVDELYPTPAPNLIPSLPASLDPVQQKRAEKGRVLMEKITLDPVAKDAINSIDDYEYDFVYQGENDRELSKALRTKLMSQRPMDWSGLPPSSAEFQAGLRESFANATPTVPENARPFRNIDGSNLVPPDTESIEMEERKILQSYKAPTAQDLESYDPEKMTPEQLIKDLYNVKGLVPTVAHKEGTNVYEVIGVRRKDEKIVYEDEEAPASSGIVMEAGEGITAGPPAAVDLAAAVDPYFDKGATTPNSVGGRMTRWNYRAWTPGLERMYGPTNATEEWH